MDDSTEGVTLYATFVQDVLKNYENEPEEFSDLFAMVAGVDLSDPLSLVPMDVYNRMCGWIEQNLGKFNLIQVGRNVGETAHEAMVTQKIISPSSASPVQVLKGLIEAAQHMIQDPKKRGWVLLESGKEYAVIRRTQSFNSKLQLGLLSGLVSKTAVSGVEVTFQNSIEEGAPFDDYLITWQLL